MNILGGRRTGATVLWPTAHRSVGLPVWSTHDGSLHLFKARHEGVCSWVLSAAFSPTSSPWEPQPYLAHLACPGRPSALPPAGESKSWRLRVDPAAEARPAPPPSSYFVPGWPHGMLSAVELRRARFFCVPG